MPERAPYNRLRIRVRPIRRGVLARGWVPGNRRETDWNAAKKGDGRSASLRDRVTFTLLNSERENDISTCFNVKSSKTPTLSTEGEP